MIQDTTACDVTVKLRMQVHCEGSAPHAARLKVRQVGAVLIQDPDTKRRSADGGGVDRPVQVVDDGVVDVDVELDAVELYDDPLRPPGGRRCSSTPS